MQIKVANPRGFCAGVDRAIVIVEKALEIFGAPVYVRHEVVHNKRVVDELKELGAIFVDELSEIVTENPQETVVIFSAHGVATSVQDEAKHRQFKVFDATCPLVTKVHMEVHKFSRDGQECVLIGHAGHPEIEGTLGQFDEALGGKIYLVENVADVEKLHVKNANKIAYVTQTTLSMDDTATIIAALREKFPHIQGPHKEDICYATQNRQDAVKKLAPDVSVMIVVGSHTSSNSNRLREVAENQGLKAYLVESEDDLQSQWFEKNAMIGVSSGASTPEILVDAVIEKIKAFGATNVELQLGVPENVVFSLPKALQREMIARSSD